MVATIPIEGAVRDVQVEDGHLLVIREQGGVVMFNVTDPLHPEQRDITGLAGGATTLHDTRTLAPPEKPRLLLVPSRILAPPAPREGWARAEQGGRRMRAAGIALTVLGAIPLIVGGAFSVATACHGGSCRPSGDDNIVIAIVFLPPMAAGASLIATGIPLWAVGQRNINRAKEARSAAALGLVPAAGPNGASLLLSGRF